MVIRRHTHADRQHCLRLREPVPPQLLDHEGGAEGGSIAVISLVVGAPYVGYACRPSVTESSRVLAGVASISVIEWGRQLALRAGGAAALKAERAAFLQQRDEATGERNE